jgi:hypothetical protein
MRYIMLYPYCAIEKQNSIMAVNGNKINIFETYIS